MRLPRGRLVLTVSQCLGNENRANGALLLEVVVDPICAGSSDGFGASSMSE